MNATLVQILRVATVCILLCCATSQSSAEQPVVEQYLINGKLDEGEAELNKLLAKNPADDQIRFELGVLQFFQAVEHLGQSLYEFGPEQSFTFGMMPFLRMPVPENPTPKAVELKDIRKMFERVTTDLTKADATLAKVKSNDVKLPLHIFKFHLDFNDNGKLDENDELGPVLMQYLGRGGRRGQNKNELEKISIAFDRADAEWLRGYCCLLRAMTETILAYDQSLFWNTIAHRLFEKGIVELDFLREEKTDKKRGIWNDSNYILDLVAGIHNARFPLKEPDRLKKAHQHLLSTIKHSRKMWELIVAETDDDREWIPAPGQATPFEGVRISQEMTETWSEFLDEAELLLSGEKLIPFWRGSDKHRGINLNTVFYQPIDIDVVLWTQGSGLVPFLEIGDCTTEETWDEFQRVFRGNFFGFAIWFN